MPDPFLRVLLVGLGGGLGAIARYGLNGLALTAFGPRLPVGTLLANALGCLAAGVLVQQFVEARIASLGVRLFLVVGFLGGMTTFSAFGYETLLLYRERGPLAAAANISANLVLSLGAVWVGWSAGRAIST